MKANVALNAFITPWCMNAWLLPFPLNFCVISLNIAFWRPFVATETGKLKLLFEKVNYIFSEPTFQKAITLLIYPSNPCIDMKPTKPTKIFHLNRLAPVIVELYNAHRIAFQNASRKGSSYVSTICDAG